MAINLKDFQRGRLRHFAKYALVSVVATLTSLTTLGLLVGLGGWSSVWANVLATSVGTVPSFELNRRWVWSPARPTGPPGPGCPVLRTLARRASRLHHCRAHRRGCDDLLEQARAHGCGRGSQFRLVRGAVALSIRLVRQGPLQEERAASERESTPTPNPQCAATASARSTAPPEAFRPCPPSGTLHCAASLDTGSCLAIVGPDVAVPGAPRVSAGLQRTLGSFRVLSLTMPS